MKNSKQDSEYRRKFLEKHNDCSELIINKDGLPLAAVYVSDWGDHQRMVLNVLRSVAWKLDWEKHYGEYLDLHYEDSKND